MKKLLLLFALLSGCVFAADDEYGSDDDAYVKVPVNIGLWPGIMGKTDFEIIGHMLKDDSEFYKTFLLHD